MLQKVRAANDNENARETIVFKFVLTQRGTYPKIAAVGFYLPDFEKWRNVLSVEDECRAQFEHLVRARSNIGKQSRRK